MAADSTVASAVWWIRRDLRLTDNQALDAALAHAARVVPVFVLDPALIGSPFCGHKRLAFLYEGLRRLDADLRARGSRLIVRRGRPVAALDALIRETRAGAIFAEEDHSPYARSRDRAVSARLPLRLLPGLTVRHPTSVLKADGQPYTVFTPFSRAWQAQPLPRASDVLSAPARMAAPPDALTEDLPAAEWLPAFPPGESEAQRRVGQFVKGRGAPIFEYAAARDRLDVPGTSALSPYLRFGMLSARQAVAAAVEARRAAANDSGRQGAQTWLSELIWREFYVSILHHFAHVRRGAFNPALRDVAWLDDPAGLDAWQQGLTGYPVVDACMRQLLEMGWMHNRGRMIVASFLTKDLLVDWQAGERWFMQHLLDGDPAANNGGWQWTAGVGTDAAPYFRVFNPTLQSKKFDPAGDFIRRHVPELSRVPGKYIHQPEKMPPEVQRQAGCMIGRDYPAPILDHRVARVRALAAYRQAKEAGRPGA